MYENFEHILILILILTCFLFTAVGISEIKEKQKQILSNQETIILRLPVSGFDTSNDFGTELIEDPNPLKVIRRKVKKGD